MKLVAETQVKCSITKCEILAIFTDSIHFLCFWSLTIHVKLEFLKFVTWFHTFLCCNKAKHAVGGNTSWGVNGETGGVADMKDYGIWEASSVKAQTYKTAIEVWLIDFIVKFIANCI